jgi:hypothetical protein
MENSSKAKEQHQSCKTVVNLKNEKAGNSSKAVEQQKSWNTVVKL